MFQSHDPQKRATQEFNQSRLEMLEAQRMREYYVAMERMLGERLQRLANFIKASESDK